MKPETLRLALFLTSVGVIVLGVGLAFGVGLALMTMGVAGLIAAVAWSWLAVTDAR